REFAAYWRIDSVAARSERGARKARSDPNGGLRAGRFRRFDACRARSGDRGLCRGAADLGDRAREVRPMRYFDVTSMGEAVYDLRHVGEAQVAVVIPLFNYAGTVLEALDSVVRQDLAELS